MFFVNIDLHVYNELNFVFVQYLQFRGDQYGSMCGKYVEHMFVNLLIMNNQY